MNPNPQIAIIGGGLAGLTAAIHLCKAGKSVVLFEKNTYPKHKVCGEFISNEVLPYFEELGLNIESLQPTHIHKTLISIISGKSISANLPLGGFGISRFKLDNYLYEKAIESGCQIINQQVNEIDFSDDLFTIQTENNKTFQAKVVLGAFGKRSNLDIKLLRNFIQKKSPWLAVKAHYKGDFPNDLVELHNFDGGYCGVSKVEDDIINICYLTKFESFKKEKDISNFQINVLNKNPKLKAIFDNSELLFEKPLTISQVSFESKKQVENHILMLGDTAGLIHPLCGNGMAMAIHSAKIASEFTLDFLNGKINRSELEMNYAKQWNFNFKSRIQMGKILSKLLLNPFLSNMMMKWLIIFPKSLPFLIQKTHGKPIQ
ncbi:NAD(P)/FAD-dependent oxidoreductase [Flavobacterium sp.]|jgi:flavin-dependent dehydrogenase|uniref:NAD(P)/FAD-dependent oxidoreductase n=1 Tax=Flavobacterium sp. TaxID=239 RepID=UPI0037BE8659